ncbi:hypothetical protein V7S43_014762 [Phytophthora oleae]|uniref:Uncharacterized protein n=1 Tax=Phytophthora oleae TaxID=2107226 RepID=A0ABD3F150_9STRA
MGRHTHESVAMQNGQQVQPEDYRVPDRRGVSVNEKRPDFKPFIASTTYLHDFPAFDEERQRVLHVPLEEYERAFMTVARKNNQQQEAATIQLSQVQEVLKLALGVAAVPRVVKVFYSYLDRRGSVRDRISWPLFSQAVDHVGSLFDHELDRCKAAGSSGETWGTFAEKQVNEYLVHSSTPASSYQTDFGTYGENVRERPYMRKRGMASTTTDLNRGTSRVTNQIPGFAGFLPSTSHSAEAVAQANGPEEIEALHPTPQTALRLFHSDNIPGYTGHKPVDCVNYRGECRAGRDPGTTTGDSYKTTK